MDMSFLGRIGQWFADGNLVAPWDGIDECLVSACEKVCYQLFVFKGALDEGDISESFKLLGNGGCVLSAMGSDLIPGQVLVFLCLLYPVPWSWANDYPTAEATRATEAPCRPVALTITKILFVMWIDAGS